MKKYNLNLISLIFILMLFFICSTTIYAGTYIYTDKDGKKITDSTKPPAVTKPEKSKEKIKKPNQTPAGTPYPHKKKDKNKKSPEKFK